MITREIYSETLTEMHFTDYEIELGNDLVLVNGKIEFHFKPQRHASDPTELKEAVVELEYDLVNQITGDIERRNITLDDAPSPMLKLKDTRAAYWLAFSGTLTISPKADWNSSKSCCSRRSAV